MTKPTDSAAARLRNLVLYVAIAVSLVILILLFAIHQADTGGSPELPLKWLGFAGMTLIVFGYAVRSHRSSRRWPEFWGLLLLFSVLHCGLGFAILSQVTTVPLLFYGILTGPEYLVLSAYLDYFLKAKR